MIFDTTRRGFLATSAAGIAAAGLMPRAAQAETAPPAGEITESTLDLVDPQYRDFVQAMPPMEINAATLPQIRAAVDASPAPGTENPPLEVLDIPGSPARIHLLRPETPVATPAPVILYIHGGGYILGSAASYDGYCYDLAQQAGALVANVAYRLAPETPFPGPVEDCHDALAYLYENAAALGADPERISIMGHSAGGGLCAALAVMARDKGAVPVKAQFPIYPMLDYRTGTTAAPVNNLATGEFVWTRQANRFGWTSLRGTYDLEDDRRGWFSPSHAETLAGLPPCFMVVGALDLFLEEDAAYALALTRARVPTAFSIYPGAVHGFDIIPGTTLTTTFRAALGAAFTRLL